MTASRIIPGLDIVEHGRAGCIPRRPNRIAEFGLDSPEVTLDDSIVLAIHFSAHAQLDVMLVRSRSEVGTRVLRAAVGMK